MNTKSLLRMLLIPLVTVLAGTMVGRAQSPYFQAVTNLHPVAYWPLQETVQPPLGDVETNLGSLGSIANAYYASTAAQKGFTGAIVGDSDTAVNFAGNNQSFMIVPTTDNRVSLPAGKPFTVELWAYAPGTPSYRAIVSHTGPINAGGNNAVSGSAGWSMNLNWLPYKGTQSGNGNWRGWTFHVFNGVGSTGGAEAGAAVNYNLNQWYYLVGVFDGTNCFVYVNGVNATSYQMPINGSFVPDTWDPIEFGCNRGLGANPYPGAVDEVAIYTNALSALTISNHYAQGIGGLGTYKTTILGDDPLMYWRMDASTYTLPAPNTYPDATNYGTAGADITNFNTGGNSAVYQPGTLPGVAGPDYPGFGDMTNACAFNGISGAVDAGYNNLFDPTDVTNNFTVVAWFKSNPMDNNGRWNCLAAHSNQSWKMQFRNGITYGYKGVGGQATISPSTYNVNDGNWHMVVLESTYTPGDSTNVTISLDGGVASTTIANPSSIPGNPAVDAFIGCAPDYLQPTNGTYNTGQQYFAGRIAHVAYFTNALTTDQIVNLYTNATGGAVPAPFITAEPYPYPSVRSVAGGDGTYIYEAVIASGIQPLSYEWYYSASSNYSGTLLTDNAKYSNTTTSQITVTNLADADSGYYYCVVSDTYGGSVTSAIVNVQIHASPFITAQDPAGPFSLYQGQNYTLSVTALAATNNLAYQWFTNGVADTAAGSGASYDLINAQPEQSGETFQCVVTNDYGSATSILATLTVNPLPASLTNSTYGSNILALHPTAYWPMHETGTAAPGDIETNYGTLGAVGTGYYADWTENNFNPGSFSIIHQVAGAVVNDSDGAADFLNPSAHDAYLLVPHTSPGTTIRPPFTLECWVNSYTANFGDIISQDGSKLNAGNLQNTYGIRIAWGGNIQIYGYATTAASASLTLGEWHHVMLTYDGTNMVLYVDGFESSSSTTTAFQPDYWDPLTIGAGFWQINGNNSGPQRLTTLSIDEVAIYTNALSSTDAYNHYNDALNGPAGQYFTDVTNLNPVLYYRLNAPSYDVRPNQSTWPVLNNYGSAAINGNYTPGLTPGAVGGPNNTLGLFAAGFSATNAMAGNGASGFADAGFAPAFNPTGNTPLTVAAWFQGNPADVRFQTIVGHSDSSWRISLDGTTGKLRFNAGAGAELTSTKIYNDGLWHQAVGVYDGATNYLYVDGVLDTENPNATNSISGSTADVILGGDPQYLTVSRGAGRQFAGNLCEVAFWNGTALNASQVAALYSAGAMPPSLTAEPPALVNLNQNTTFAVSVGAAGPDLAYQWYYNASSNYAGATALTDGSTGHGSTVSGAATSDLIITTVQKVDAGYYYAVVSNTAGSVTSSIVALTINSLPEFTLQPVSTNLLLFVGGHVSLTVSAIGAEPLEYQWYTNDVPDTSTQGTNSTYYHSPILDNTTIYCVASNFVGVSTSEVVSVTTIAAPTAPYPVKVLGDNPYGFWRMNEPTNGLNNGNAGVVTHDYWGGNNGAYTNVDLGVSGYAPATEPSETAAEFGQTGISFIDSYAGEIQGIDFAAPTNSSSDFSIEAWVKGGTQSISGAGVVTKGYGNGGEQFNLDMYANHYRFFVRDANGGVHGYTSSVSPDGQWHHVVGVCDESGGTVTLYVDGQALGSGTITPGTGILESTNVMSIGARRSGAGTNNYDFQFYGDIDDVAVYNYALSAEQVRAHWSSPGVAPILVQAPPSAITVNEGGTLTLPAAGIGTPPLTNTWFDTFYFTNITQTIVPATNYADASLVVSNVPVDWDFDTLQLTIGNPYGSVSTNVTLSVASGAPVIVQDLPTPVTTFAGRPYTYTIGVQGTEPFHYQWKSNGVDLVGENASSYTFNAVSGNYSVVVTNTYGAVTSTVSAMTAVGTPTNAYASYVLTNLGAVGYWPLQETNPPAMSTFETNLGTLGSLGTGLYGGTNALNLSLNQGGALTGSGDTDPSVGFAPGNQNSYLYVPLKTPQLYLNPPFTFECWVNSSSTGFADVMGNGGLDGDGSGNWSGLRMSYAGNTTGGPTLQAYVYYGSGGNYHSTGAAANLLPLNTWHQCVLTYDGTTLLLYIDGTQVKSMTTSMASNYWTPLTIGTGRWDNGPTRSYEGLLDEAAVYTNVLSAQSVTNHYLAAITPGSNYVASVLADSPLLYYRMDAMFTNPSPVVYPTALNFGSSPVQGHYLAGTVPGQLAGPAYAAFGTNEVATAINGAFSCVDAAYDPAFNPTGFQPFTVMTWFKGYPWDARTQTIVGQGGNWAFNIDGSNGRIVWNLYSGGVPGAQVTSSGVLNDGNWHFLAGVYDGTNAYIYVDGALDASGPASASGMGGDANVHLFLGGDASSTFENSAWGARYFAGALAETAYFTNALTADQIAQAYNRAGLQAGATPTISMQNVGGQLQITYTGRLLSAPNAQGPYSDVTGAPIVGNIGNTITITPSTSQLFYRAVNP